MRQLFLQVPAGTSGPLQAAAVELGASTLTRLAGADEQGEPVELLVLTAPNGAVGPLLDEAERAGRMEASMPSAGAFAFEPPAGRAPQELLDVTARSPEEVVLAGRQAAGGWLGFLTFAATAGAVAWLGLYTETVYLLTGSMLIAPFAGPAMNSAIALASGRPHLLRHSVGRYVVGILVTALAAAALTALIGPTTVPGLLGSVLSVTGGAVLLPLAAGVAGATYLVQSEHSSLISGAAVGVLVAASLAPPAAGLGLVAALGRWDLAGHALFLILLQLTGIAAAAVSALWLAGLRPVGQRFSGGRPLVTPVGAVAAVTLTVALVALQVLVAPQLLEGSRARTAADVAADEIGRRADTALLGVEPSVSEATDLDRPRILLDVAVERRPSAPPADALRRRLETSLTAALRDATPDVVPQVDVTVFEPPGPSGAPPG